MFTVKNYGVSFSTKKSDIALTNFFVSLVGADIDFPIRTDSARKIIIDQDEKYIYGTVITIKNQKKFTSLVGKGSNLEIGVWGAMEPKTNVSSESHRKGAFRSPAHPPGITL
ncbi:hypothetical protein GHW02_04750 [Pseudomonas aeruginosa]|uniref:hypothetical protein n=1 Tax=Pseudomonas pseudonitroreducens TaxID=2892326 RepID=UPI0018C6175E|nr:hypothetical protein [Pseudomonas pseudonitroreducens]MBG4712330.1 hypothetical protein [Pseudomonas aeruginosa]MBG4799021.1 hypothetical protein [Pseudomonas aeruginosa]